MNKIELNRHINNVIKLRKQLKIEEELVMQGMDENGLTSKSTTHGQAYITEESTGLRFDTKRFKEDNEETYNSYLIETIRKRYLTIKESK